MPNPLFCWHKWGKWSKPRNGVKRRSCLKKCGKTQKRNAGFFDRLFCWHKYGGNRGRKPITSCVKCGKPKKLNLKRPGQQEARLGSNP